LRHPMDSEDAVGDDIRELRARQVAEALRLWLRKDRVGPDLGLYTLVDMGSNTAVHGPRASLRQVEAWLARHALPAQTQAQHAFEPPAQT